LIEAAVGGEVILVVADDKHIIRLVSLKQPKQPYEFGSAKGLIYMTESFAAPLDDCREDMA